MTRIGLAASAFLSLGLVILCPGYGIAGGSDEARLRQIYDQALTKAGKSFLKPPELKEAQKKGILQELNQALDQAARETLSKQGASGPDASQSDAERQRSLEELKKQLLQEADLIMGRAVALGACPAPARGGVKDQEAEIEFVGAQLHVAAVRVRYQEFCFPGGRGSPEKAAAVELALQRGVGEEGRGRIAAAHGAAGRIAAALGSQKAPESVLSSPQSQTVSLTGGIHGSASDAAASRPRYDARLSALDEGTLNKVKGLVTPAPPPMALPAGASSAKKAGPGFLEDPRGYFKAAGAEARSSGLDHMAKARAPEISLLGKAAHLSAAAKDSVKSGAYKALSGNRKAILTVGGGVVLGGAAVAATVALAPPAAVAAVGGGLIAGAGYLMKTDTAIELAHKAEIGTFGAGDALVAGATFLPLPGSEKLGQAVVKSGAARVLLQKVETKVGVAIAKNTAADAVRGAYRSTAEFLSQRTREAG